MKFRVDSSVLIYKGNVADFDEEIELEICSEREINVRYCFVPRLFDCIAVGLPFL